GPDISLVLTSYEDDSTSAPNFPSSGSSLVPSISVAPSSSGVSFNPAYCLAISLSKAVCSIGGIGTSYTCPPGSVVIITNSINVSCTGTIASRQRTWYAATDGRVNGGAGDRIAIYCRRTGRIEVWSINNSVGQFLVSFKHEAVDAAGKAGFSVSVGAQGIVTIGGGGHGPAWGAIHGGSYHATGRGA